MRSLEDRIELANAFVYTAGQQAQIVALMQPLHLSTEMFQVCKPLLDARAMMSIPAARRRVHRERDQNGPPRPRRLPGAAQDGEGRERKVRAICHGARAGGAGTRCRLRPPLLAVDAVDTTVPALLFS